MSSVCCQTWAAKRLKNLDKTIETGIAAAKAETLDKPSSKKAQKMQVIVFDLLWRKRVLAAVLEADTLPYAQLAAMAAYLCEPDLSAYNGQASELADCIKKLDDGRGQALMQEVYDLYNSGEKRAEMMDLLQRAARYTLDTHNKASRMFAR